MLPTFIVIGAAKAGTTSLSAYLRAHPQVFVSSPKEPHFFFHNWDRGVSWYETLFEPGRAQSARGEASTSYSQAPHVPGVPERIASVVPDVKLVYVIRNPVDRIRSQYAHFVDRWRESLSLEQAIISRPVYLNASRYAAQLEMYLAHFQREQILIVSSEELRVNREAVLRQVFNFIEVDANAPIHTSHLQLNRTADKRLPPASVDAGRRMLRRTGLSRLVPKTVKGRVRTALSKPIPSNNLEISPEVEEAIWEELKRDLEHLRGLVGPNFDLWGRA